MTLAAWDTGRSFHDQAKKLSLGLSPTPFLNLMLINLQIDEMMEDKPFRAENNKQDDRHTRRTNRLRQTPY